VRGLRLIPVSSRAVGKVPGRYTGKYPVFDRKSREAIGRDKK
jgi:hypothetical protein